ncbi:hypothetical protein ES703_32108 [subsurface metagenome]
MARGRVETRLFDIELEMEEGAEQALFVSFVDGGKQMARMDSPAGEMEITFLRIAGVKNQMVVTSKFGAWDSKIYFTPDELAHMIRLMLNSSVVLFLLRFPFVFISRWLFWGKRPERRKRS